MKRLHKLASYGFILGLIHTGLTPFFYARLSEEALWFAMTGVALIYLGLLNLAAGRVWQAWLFDICIAANLVMLAFNVVTLFLMPPTAVQAYVALLITLAVTIASVGCRIQVVRSPKPSLSSLK